jgi:parallel beta-helix repeat protein
MINTVKNEIASNNFQSSSTGSVEEPVIEDTEETITVYPQQWATGDGTIENPWANNCLNSALANVPDGGTIFLRAGYYTLSTFLWSDTKSYNLIGEGRNKTFIITGMTDTMGIYISTDYCTLKGFTIDGTSMEESLEDSHLIGIGSDYITLEDIEVENAGSCGINLVDVNHQVFKNVYVHDSYSHGIHCINPTAETGKYNTFQNIYSWDNGKHGFDNSGFGGAGIKNCFSIYDNIQCWGNGEDGLGFHYITGGIISNCSAWDNVENGIRFNHVEDFDVHDCEFNLNYVHGVKITFGKNTNFTNVTAMNNSVSGSSRMGIVIADCINITLTNCQFYDDRNIPLQFYGLYLEGTNTGISLLSCKLTPNASGDIYNPNDVAVTIITDKMLAKL